MGVSVCLMAKMLDFDLDVREFEIQPCCYVHFRTNILGKGMKPLIPPALC